MKVSTIQLITWVISLVNFVVGGYTNDEMLKLVDKNGKHKVLTLTDKNYEKFVNGPRDYHILMLLSSQSGQFQCPLCNEFKPEFDLVANSWFQDHPQGIGEKAEGKDIYFFFSEFLNSKELFKDLKLNNIPKVFHLPPTTVSTKGAWLDEVEEYQFFQGNHAELLMTWLQDLTGHKFSVHVPVNYNKIMVNIGVTVLAAILIKVFFKQFKMLVTSKALWCLLSIVAILLFTTGYMFNQIRGVPYIREYPDGRVEYFMQGQQMQLGIETQILSFAYGILSLLFIVLIKRVPEISHPRVRLIASTIATISIYVAFSYVLKIFGLKSPGYPFKFLKF